MALLDTIEQHMREAMKARDEARLNALRMIKSALVKHRADTARPLDEKAELQILNMLIKQRREAAEMFRQGGREDLAAKEEAELRLIESYMPPTATEEEMDAAVEAALAETGATSLKQMGAVMKAAQARLAGKRVDNKILSDKVRARLGG
jgi:uncharacterized protein YqeY